MVLACRIAILASRAIALEGFSAEKILVRSSSAVSSSGATGLQ